jgi:cysteine synthase A
MPVEHVVVQNPACRTRMQPLRLTQRTGLSRRDFLILGSAAAVGTTAIPTWLATRAESAELLASALPLKDPAWRRWAINTLGGELESTGSTLLLSLDPPFNPNSPLLLKNEAASRTGSLKHRVAWALLMWGLIGSGIHKNLHLYERTSGNTGIAEAYFAQRLKLPYTAVAAAAISQLKLGAIRNYGGNVLVVPEGERPTDFYQHVISNDPLAYDINQFASAEKAIAYFQGTPAETENLANALILQRRERQIPHPNWFVIGAASGGTATRIGRYMRKWGPHWGMSSRTTRVLVPDAEHSVLFDWYRSGNTNLTSSKPSLIEGVGSSGPIRFGQTFSLQRGVVDRMLKVPNALSIAAMHLVNELVGALQLLCQQQRNNTRDPVASVICDGGERHADTYYNPTWLAAKGLN